MTELCFFWDFFIFEICTHAFFGGSFPIFQSQPLVFFDFFFENQSFTYLWDPWQKGPRMQTKWTKKFRRLRHQVVFWFLGGGVGKDQSVYSPLKDTPHWEVGQWLSDCMAQNSQNARNETCISCFFLRRIFDGLRPSRNHWLWTMLLSGMAKGDAN